MPEPVFVPARTRAERAMFSVARRTRQEEAAEILARPNATYPNGMINPRVVSLDEARIVAQARAEAEIAAGPKPQFGVVSPGELAGRVIGRPLELAARPFQVAGAVTGAVVPPTVSAFSPQLGRLLGARQRGGEVAGLFGQAATGKISPRELGGKLIEEEEKKPLLQQVVSELPASLIPPVGGVKAVATGTKVAVKEATRAGAKALVSIPQRRVQETGLRLAGARGVAGGAIRLEPHERGSRITRFLDSDLQAKFKATNKAIEDLGMKMDALAGTREDEFFVGIDVPKGGRVLPYGRGTEPIPGVTPEIGIKIVDQGLSGKRLFFKSFDDVDQFLKTGEYKVPSITSPLRPGPIKPLYVTEKARVAEPLPAPQARFFDSAIEERKEAMLRQVDVDPESVKVSTSAGFGRTAKPFRSIPAFTDLPQDAQAKLARLAFGGVPSEAGVSVPTAALKQETRLQARTPAAPEAAAPGAKELKPRIHFTPTNLYELPAAKNNIRYRDWLMGVNNAGIRLTGVEPVKDMKFARRFQAWYKAGVDPVEAVRKWQGVPSKAPTKPVQPIPKRVARPRGRMPANRQVEPIAGEIPPSAAPVGSSRQAEAVSYEEFLPWDKERLVSFVEANPQNKAAANALREIQRRERQVETLQRIGRGQATVSGRTKGRQVSHGLRSELETFHRQEGPAGAPSRQAEPPGGVVRKEAVEDIAAAPSPAARAWATGESRPFAFDPNSTANQGRFRLLAPKEGGKYITRQSGTPGVSYIVDAEANAIQAVRFNKATFPEAKAAEWWEANKGRFKFSGQAAEEAAPAPGRTLRVRRTPPPQQGAPGAAPVEAAGVAAPPTPAAAPDEAATRRLLVEQMQAEDRAAGIKSDWKAFAKDADPSGGGPPGGRPPTGVGGDMPPPDPIDDVFERFRTQATRGEPISEALLRRHAAAINTAENEARIFVDEATRRFQKMGLGQIRQGRLLFKQEEVPLMDNLFEALHNPSKVADGTFKVPPGLEGEYQRLRALTNWEEAMRIDFDPSMATVEDYFYRGWVVPKEGVAKAVSGVPRGRLGITPSFKKPRVDATYREMRDLGFEPMSWNPYEQWRISRLQGVRYRQQMQLVDDLKKLDLAVTDASGVGVQDWRTPKVGPAFEGKIFAATDASGEPVAMYSRRWVVPSDLANRLENMYGVTPDLGNVHIGNRTIDLMKAIDVVTFVPKRAKLFGSFFQQMDFLTRSGVGAWAGMVDALVAGRPIEAVRRLAVWPKSAISIVEANLRPRAREAIRRQLNSTTPLIPGRPGIHLRGIMEGGLSTIDVTILPKDIDQMARMVAKEAGLLGNKAVQRAIGSLESTMRRGLFEGVYPAAQIADIKNNVAPMIVRLYGKESDEAINGMIAKVINKKYSTIPASQSVLQNRALREGLRRLFFSIGESEGLLRQAAGAIRGPEAGYWRTHWIGAYLGLIAVASAIHFASTGEPLPWQRWLPVNKNKWGPLPVGYNPEFAAPNIPVKDTEGRQLLLDIVGQLDTAFRILDPPGFLSSRESVPVRALTTQVSERDYFGRSITKVGPGGIYSRTANLINDMFAPIGPGQAAAQIGLRQGRIPEGLIPSSEARLGTAGQLIQGTGLNLRAQQPATKPAIPTRTRQRIPVRKERVKEKERERVPVNAR